MAQFQSSTTLAMTKISNNRTTSSSSFNTRQREMYEGTGDLEPRPSTPHLTITRADGESEDEEDARRVGPLSMMDASYPALELPFASEPALETEQETELPPLKKLRSTRLNGGDKEDVNDSDHCLESVRGILTKKDHSSPEDSGLSSPIHTSPVPQILGSSPLASALVVSNPPTSRPHSRRTSSNRSAVSSANSHKTVRFAAACKSSPCDHMHGKEQSSDEDTTGCSCDLDTPVATVMYLTHSAKVYDRTSIVVEKSLRLPPRQDPSETGRWVQQGESSGLIDGGERQSSGYSSPTQSSRRDELESKNDDCEAWRAKNHAINSNDSEGVTLDTFPTSPSSSFLPMTTHSSILNLQHFRNREECEDDLEDEEDCAPCETEVDDEEEEYDVGAWSQGQVFRDDDILGGF
ncbi:hypothetical protein DFH28DRAFT_1215972 [Melampsora americana]|nr:hypothetical protein DFH28DRAFT_1215972 [Melampsora americana]